MITSLQGSVHYPISRGALESEHDRNGRALRASRL
jgi:hypothetical protein